MFPLQDTAREWASELGAVMVGEMDILGGVSPGAKWEQREQEQAMPASFPKH